MKKIIRYLANISGVTQDIRKEEKKQLGMDLIDYHYWFVGNKFRVPISNALLIIGEDLRKDIRTRASSLRDEVDELRYNQKYNK